MAAGQSWFNELRHRGWDGAYDRIVTGLIDVFAAWQDVPRTTWPRPYVAIAIPTRAFIKSHSPEALYVQAMNEVLDRIDRGDVRQLPEGERMEFDHIDSGEVAP